jgi:putative hydrolase of the HAD superfamily
MGHNRPSKPGDWTYRCGQMIRHVLFDADGVVQDMPVTWYEAMEPYVGERAREFLHETWRDELPMLAGEGDYFPVLAKTLADYGVETAAEDVYASVWLSLDVDAGSVALIGALRSAGYGVHLGTNQEKRRAAHMRTALGYDDLFDVSCYSCDLGIAKPDPEFFKRATTLINAAPSEVLFIDDSLRNVQGAQTAGLQAEQWQIGDGHDSLRALLRAHGVGLPDPR